MPETPACPQSPGDGLRWLGAAEPADLMAQLPHRPLLAGEKGLRLSLAGSQVKLPVVIDNSSGGASRVALPLGALPPSSNFHTLA